MRMLLIVILAWVLAGCGAGAATATPTGQAVEWVELDEPISLDGLDLDGDAATAAPPEALPLAEAQARLPFTLALPAWVPAGYVQQELVEVIGIPAEPDGYASAIVTWENADGAVLQLQVSTSAAGQPRLGGGGRSEAATINGQPATLVHLQRPDHERLSLSWSREALAYQLTAESQDLTGDDLVRVAESIKVEE